jgi:hypothetical protein
MTVASRWEIHVRSPGCLEALDTATGTTTALAHAPGLAARYCRRSSTQARLRVRFGGGPDSHRTAAVFGAGSDHPHWTLLDPDGVQPAARMRARWSTTRKRGEVWMFGGVGDASPWRYTPPDAPTRSCFARRIPRRRRPRRMCELVGGSRGASLCACSAVCVTAWVDLAVRSMSKAHDSNFRFDDRAGTCRTAIGSACGVSLRKILGGEA